MCRSVGSVYVFNLVAFCADNQVTLDGNIFTQIFNSRWWRSYWSDLKKLCVRKWDGAVWPWQDWWVSWVEGTFCWYCIALELMLVVNVLFSVCFCLLFVFESRCNIYCLLGVRMLQKLACSRAFFCSIFSLKSWAIVVTCTMSHDLWCRIKLCALLCALLSVVCRVIKDSRTALHETCRSQSDAEEDLHDIAKLLIDAGAQLDSKAVDAGEVHSCFSVVCK